MGTRTGGAGCGHIDGGEPVVLANSRAVLALPNCYSDGAAVAGRLTAARLPEAAAAARAMDAR